MVIKEPPLPSDDTLGLFNLEWRIVVPYELQTDKANFARAWSWGAGGGGILRTLRLLGMPDAPYSDEQMRIPVASSYFVLSAINYLFIQPDGVPALRGLPRYQPQGEITFCNIFINDVTRILHCEIPNNPNNTVVHEMLCWLLSPVGRNAGWNQIESATPGLDAQRRADLGQVVVMLKSDEEGEAANDHIALVRPQFVNLQGGLQPLPVQPDETGDYWPRVAQAGLVVSDNADSRQTFGMRGQIKFFWHL